MELEGKEEEEEEEEEDEEVKEEEEELLGASVVKVTRRGWEPEVKEDDDDDDADKDVRGILLFESSLGLMAVSGDSSLAFSAPSAGRASVFSAVLVSVSILSAFSSTFSRLA